MNMQQALLRAANTALAVVCAAIAGILTLALGAGALFCGYRFVLEADSEFVTWEAVFWCIVGAGLAVGARKTGNFAVFALNSLFEKTPS